ncbi:hypothetical protein M3T53_09635 [Actinomyces sp. B33]|uniref:hypothetical protein n=1 Tax=Actinomyces sp. B33 TaxID=2942131 RepID=UPI002342640C|nr:hypothetical protein [Actinomyces sp. B33]MDC4233952.1 hypothetical protein [Actinomyces sp. B33]
MNTRIILAPVLVLGLAASALTGCSSSGSASDPAPAQSAASTQALGPITKDPTVLDGTTVTVPVKRELVLDVPDDSDVTAWSAVIDDPASAEFVPGTADGSMTTNPGIHPLAETEGVDVAITDPEGRTVTFTLRITPGER